VALRINMRDLNDAAKGISWRVRKKDALLQRFSNSYSRLAAQ